MKSISVLKRELLQVLEQTYAWLRRARVLRVNNCG
jgi:hypothetical protein